MQVLVEEGVVILFRLPYRVISLKRERVENTTRSGVFLTSGDETLSRMLHITSQTMILEKEIKDAQMSSFSSGFQTLITHKFPLYFLYEFLMSLRNTTPTFKYCQYNSRYIRN